MVRVAVVGSGYVGLCTGVVLAEAGHDVTLVDSDARKVAAVGEGRAPFYEPGLDEALARLRGRIGGTTALPDAVAAAEFTYLCVGTPQGEDGRIDLAHVRAASADVGRALRRAARGHVVVVKSTVVPGTADGTVAPEVEAASGLREGRDFHVVSNPEFLQEGSALRNARSPDRVVAGGDPAACRRVLDLHKPGCPEVVVDRRTAETIKYAANAFLATKVAFANEMANVCARLGVDWYD
ncbi:MAG TPA: nucleotide sugar dehydrogenase, partial [Candidatus Thermoplasmatota archaeon]|nr:nucleotide sugar dehydrogenase [Candidatus Thermoplasmatota archaeon]